MPPPETDPTTVRSGMMLNMFTRITSDVEHIDASHDVAGGGRATRTIYRSGLTFLDPVAGNIVQTSVPVSPTTSERFARQRIMTRSTRNNHLYTYLSPKLSYILKAHRQNSNPYIPSSLTLHRSIDSDPRPRPTHIEHAAVRHASCECETDPNHMDSTPLTRGATPGHLDRTFTFQTAGSLTNDQTLPPRSPDDETVARLHADHIFTNVLTTQKTPIQMAATYHDIRLTRRPLHHAIGAYSRMQHQFITGRVGKTTNRITILGPFPFDGSTKQIEQGEKQRVNAMSQAAIPPKLKQRYTEESVLPYVKNYIDKLVPGLKDTAELQIFPGVWSYAAKAHFNSYKVRMMAPSIETAQTLLARVQQGTSNGGPKPHFSLAASKDGSRCKAGTDPVPIAASLRMHMPESTGLADEARKSLTLTVFMKTELAQGAPPSLIKEAATASDRCAALANLYGIINSEHYSHNDIPSAIISTMVIKQTHPIITLPTRSHAIMQDFCTGFATQKAVDLALNDLATPEDKVAALTTLLARFKGKQAIETIVKEGLEGLGHRVNDEAGTDSLEGAGTAQGPGEGGQPTELNWEDFKPRLSAAILPTLLQGQTSWPDWKYFEEATSTCAILQLLNFEKLDPSGRGDAVRVQLPSAAMLDTFKSSLPLSISRRGEYDISFNHVRPRAEAQELRVTIDGIQPQLLREDNYLAAILTAVTRAAVGSGSLAATAMTKVGNAVRNDTVGQGKLLLAHPVTVNTIQSDEVPSHEAAHYFTTAFGEPLSLTRKHAAAANKTYIRLLVGSEASLAALHTALFKELTLFDPVSKKALGGTPIRIKPVDADTKCPADETELTFLRLGSSWSILQGTTPKAALQHLTRQAHAAHKGGRGGNQPHSLTKTMTGIVGANLVTRADRKVAPPQPLAAQPVVDIWGSGDITDWSHLITDPVAHPAEQPEPPDTATREADALHHLLADMGGANTDDEPEPESDTMDDPANAHDNGEEAMESENDVGRMGNMGNPAAMRRNATKRAATSPSLKRDLSHEMTVRRTANVNAGHIPSPNSHFITDIDRSLKHTQRAADRSGRRERIRPWRNRAPQSAKMCDNSPSGHNSESRSTSITNRSMVVEDLKHTPFNSTPLILYCVPQRVHGVQPTALPLNRPPLPIISDATTTACTPTPPGVITNNTTRKPQKPRPTLIGGASYTNNTHRLSTIDKLMRAQGLNAHHNFEYDVGNCGFDAMAWLNNPLASSATKKAMSLTIRKQSVDLLSKEWTEKGAPNDFENMCSSHGCPNMTPEQYTTRMKLCAHSNTAGLWADTTILHWVGISSGHSLEIYSIVNNDDGEPYLSISCIGTPRRVSLGTHRLLFTGESERGHFTPVTWSHEPQRTRPIRLIPPGLYWEPQTLQFCCVHAFNALMSPTDPDRMSSPHEVISWFEHQRRSPMYPHHKSIFNEARSEYRQFNTKTGNFTIPAFAFWAFTQQNLNLFEIHTPIHTSPDIHTLTTFLYNLQTNEGYELNGFLVRTQEINGIIEYSHMTAIVLHGGQWYWLDSDAPERATLTGIDGERNFTELKQVARQFYGFTVATSTIQLGDCPIACQVFPPSPPTVTIHPDILSPSPAATARRQREEHPPRADLQPRRPILKSRSPKLQKTSVAPMLPQQTQPPLAPPGNIHRALGKTRSVMPLEPLQNEVTISRKSKALEPAPKRLKQTSITNYTTQPKEPGNNPTTRSPTTGPPPPAKRNTTDKAPQHHKESPPTPPQKPQLVCITANTPSLYAHKPDASNLIRQYKPDIITFVDVRLCDKHRNTPWLHELFQGYKYWVNTSQEDGAGARGVLIAVKEHLAVLGKATRTTGDTCRGRILTITLTLPHSAPLSITGVYGPAGSTPVDENERTQMYTRITEICEETTHMYGTETKNLMMGDWNAALLPGDRASNLNHEKDKAHQKYIKSRKLSPLDSNKAPNRSHTYSHLTDSSRIDDIYTDFHTNATTLAIDKGALSDHLPLMGRIDLQGTNVFIPTERRMPTGPPVKALVRPISNEDKAAFLDKVYSYTHGQGANIDKLLSKLDGILTTDVKPFFTNLEQQNNGKSSKKLATINGRDAAETIEILAVELMEILQASKDIALDTCETKMTNPCGTHYPKRSEAKKRARLNKALETLRNLYKETHLHNTTSRDQVQDLINTTFVTPEVQNRWDNALKDEEKAGLNGQAILLAIQKETRLDIKEMDREQNKEAMNAAIARKRSLIDKKPKVANRQIFKPQNQKSQYLAFTDPETNIITDDPDYMKYIAHKHFVVETTAPGGKKTGLYHPDVTPRSLPWDKSANPKAYDTFTLETGATSLQSRPWLHNAISDENVFYECLTSLGNGKTPGPDGLENELLKMMPNNFKECMHKLMIIMWATRITPHAWKNSHTILLEKDKGDQTLVGKRRPIGLLNSIYKLWTKLTTKAMADYAERYRILSPAQKGFRKWANTMEQLQLLIMALEDARDTGQDIFNIQVDFCSAFNTLDHDRLLQIMYDLDSPQIVSTWC